MTHGNRPSSTDATIPAIIAYVFAVTLVLTVGAVWASAGWILAVMRQKSRKKKAPSDWYVLRGERAGVRAGGR